MKTKKKLKKRLSGLLEAFANAFTTVIDDELSSRNKFVCNASCSGEGTTNVVSVFKHQPLKCNPVGTGSFGACSDVGTIGPTPFKDDGGGSGSFIPLPTGPCGVIGSTGPTEVREPRLVGMTKDYGCTGWTSTGLEVLVLPNDRQLLSDLKFKMANHERDFKNAFRTLQNVMSFNDLNNIHIDDLLSKLDSSYKNYVCYSNTFHSLDKKDK